jgi:iron complex transport system ATP-binding protein
MRIEVEELRVRLGGRSVVSGATLLVSPGEVAGLVGPNGSGKSSLLRTVYRHLRPADGRVDVGEASVWALPARHAARRVAAVPQDTRTEFDVTAWDMVAMGRTPHKRPFAADSKQDKEIVRTALARVGVEELAARPYPTLSGGERQRVLVARALAQQTPVLVLDEPTNHLDVRHQLEVLELVRELGLTTLLALHDLNLAAGYCDRVHVLLDGRLVAGGPPAEVLTPALVRSVFGVHADLVTHPRNGRAQLLLSPLEEDQP